MKCLIVDDNPIARTTLAQLCTQVKDLTISATCSSAIEACNYLQNDDVDILLLDIEMPEMSGLDLTKYLDDKDLVIIFTTSKREYAVDAFDLNVADFIVKPVTLPRFIQAIDKARAIIDSRKEEFNVSSDEFIFIRDSNVIRRLSLDEILYAEAMGDYVKLHTKNKLYAIHATFKTAESRLPASRFIRVHRSYIVAINKIDSLREGGLVIDGKFLPVADAHRGALNKRINIF